MLTDRSKAGVEVSVVLPAYNEATTIEHTVDATLDALGSFLPDGRYEVIVAEDGCSDRTPEIASRLATEIPCVHHFHSDNRLGRGGALERAFIAADGETLVYFDTDLATDLRHLEELVESVRSGAADVATGSRWMPGKIADRPPQRSIASRGYNTLARMLLRSDVRDHQCGFKAFDRTALFDILDDVRDDHWFWDTEVLVRAQRAGYRVHEFPVQWDSKGDSKVSLFRDILDMGSQLGSTWWELDVKPRLTPRVSIAAGVTLSLVALVAMTLYLDPMTVLAALTGAELAPVALATLVYTASWPFRGERYRIILDELGHTERVGFLTGAVFISQTGNLVFPARAGDAIRAYVVKARRAIPYTTGFASLAVERVYDLVTITVLSTGALVSLAIVGDLGQLAAAIAVADRAGRTAIAVGTAVGLLAFGAFLAILVTARSDRSLVRATFDRLGSRRAADHLADHLEGLVGDIQLATSSFTAFSRIGSFSLAIWALDVATAVLVLGAFGVGIDPVPLLGVGFLAVSVGNLAKVLPLSPGGIGLYEAAFTLIVASMLPVAGAIAFAGAVLDHAVKNIVTVVGGVVSMLVLNVSLTTAVGADDQAIGARPTRQD